MVGALLGALVDALVDALVAPDSHKCTSVKAGSTNECLWVLCKVRKQASRQQCGDMSEARGCSDMSEARGCSDITKV